MTDTTDQVKRLLQFSTRHPGWQVISPRDTRSVLRGELDWRATGPGNQFIRERELSDLIDEMEQAAALADGLGHDAELARLRAQHTNWDYIGKRAGGNRLVGQPGNPPRHHPLHHRPHPPRTQPGTIRHRNLNHPKRVHSPSRAPDRVLRERR